MGDLTPEFFDLGVTAATGRYSQKEIAQAFDIHYAAVSRILKTKTPFACP